MAKLPRRPDPERLRRIEPEIATLDPDTVLHRIYSRGGDFPTTWHAFRRFGPLASHFDHHEPDAEGAPRPQEHAILYAALDLPSAFAEVFQHNKRRINRRRREPWLASFRLGTPLELLDLCDTFALRVGASMKLHTDTVLVAQRWSRAFHEAYPGIDGVRCPSSLTGRPCVALYERAEPSLAEAAELLFHRALADPALQDVVRRLADEIGYAIV